MLETQTLEQTPLIKLLKSKLKLKNGKYFSIERKLHMASAFLDFMTSYRLCRYYHMHTQQMSQINVLIIEEASKHCRTQNGGVGNPKLMVLVCSFLLPHLVINALPVSKKVT